MIRKTRKKVWKAMKMLGLIENAAKKFTPTFSAYIL